MTKTFQKFKKLPINFSAIGLEQEPSTSDYFCTPKGAKLIGWAGIDGIHYCFLKDFGEMVFSVSPCNLPGDYVHPLARNFEDFLRLMLACNGVDAVEQAHGWGKDIFEEYLVENPLTEKLSKEFKVIQDKLRLTPMEQPFEYIKSVQAEFDYSKLRFKKGYKEYISGDMSKEVCLGGAAEALVEATETLPWCVYFGQGIWHQGGKEKPGTEIPINKQFFWNGNVFHVPAVYACSKGLVIDFCVEIEPEKIKEFLGKIEKYGDREDKWSDEVREEMHRTNPTEINFFAEVVVNGKQLKRRNGIGFGWMPESLRPEAGGWANEPEIEQTIEHYQLDRNKGWMFERKSFAWATVKKPVIKSLKLTMKAEAVSMVAKRFITPEIGKSVTFTRPLTGEEYTLTVQEVENQEMDGKRMERVHHEELEIPTHYKAMTYSLSPDLPGMQFFVQDTKQSDRPRTKPQQNKKQGEDDIAASSIAIIGGADGPTSVFLLSSGSSRHPHSAYSALHFEPVQEVEWKAVFREKLCEDLQVDLL